MPNYSLDTHVSTDSSKCERPMVHAFAFTAKWKGLIDAFYASTEKYLKCGPVENTSVYIYLHQN